MRSAVGALAKSGETDSSCIAFVNSSVKLPLLVRTNDQTRGMVATHPRQSRGFAMMVTTMMIILLALIAIGLLSISSIELRSNQGANAQQVARANARLALTIAIGELQTFLGPDQRVSAPSSILEKDTPVAHPHWVGVWSTTKANGESFWQRDDLDGGLRDERFDEQWSAREEALSYLVSGNEGGRLSAAGFEDPHQAASSGDSWVHLVAGGTLGRAVDFARQAVKVPKVTISESGEQTGSYAYWVGDLGVRANIKTHKSLAKPLEGEDGLATAPEEELFKVMASQEADVSAMASHSENEIEPLTARERKSLITDNQWPLVNEDRDWATGLWHDVTTWSKGVLADSREGGLRKNLTAYLAGESLSLEKGSEGLQDSDNLVGPRNDEHALLLGQDWSEGRYQRSAPTFGILRDWANNTTTLIGEQLDQRIPETEYLDSSAAGARSAFANDQSVRLTNRVRTDLQPILVEGSMYSTISYHPNPADFEKAYNIRTHHWPRVVLWNPYNVPILTERSVMMMQLNSRNDFETSCEQVVEVPNRDPISFFFTAQWISWGGGTRTPPPAAGEDITQSANYNDPYSGMRYFSLPGEVIEPGECYVYSPAYPAEYDGGNILSNALSSQVAPDPSRNFYVSSSEFDDDDTGSGFNYKLLNYRYSPVKNVFFGWGMTTVNNQADDSRMVWKNAEGRSTVSIFDFDALPQLQSVSCSLQYGAGKEPQVSWSENRTIPVEFTNLRDPLITSKPDVRSREGFRLRWFEEHPSNTGVLNSPAGSTAFETAPLANWNLRSTFAIRSPWSNIAGDQGDGVASGPWFFGAYTRDLYDSAVGWDEQLPFFRNGRYHGNPFGTPQEGRLRNILFEVPREETGILSLAQLQHAKLSEFIWHPSYAIGNSLIDPRLGLDGMAGTAPPLNHEVNGGWNADASGWTDDNDRAADDDEWARFARFIMKDLPADENLVYDLSYEVNHSLWDEFFLLSGNRFQWRDFVEGGRPLPNGRMELLNGGREEDLADISRAASTLMVDGAFNVNSTSVEAWKALLSSTRQSEFSKSGNTPFPRSPFLREKEFLAENDIVDSDEAWEGFRSLSDEEIGRLAIEIVEQVKLRGPFLSLSDFVNRRLRPYGPGDETGVMGPLQAAIEAAGLNDSFIKRWELDKSEGELPDYTHPDNIADATRISQTLKPASKAWGAPGYLTQADLLQVIGPALNARSDTFLIRSYGEALNESGQVIATAWCEAVVQRTPKPMVADESGLNPDPDKPNGMLGRRFELKSLRWLSEQEV